MESISILVIKREFWYIPPLFDQLFVSRDTVSFFLKFYLSIWNFLISGNFLKSGISACRKHHQTHRKLSRMTCPNATTPSSNHITSPLAMCLGDPEHSDILGHPLKIWSFLIKKPTGHQQIHTETTQLWLNKEKLFNLIFTTYQKLSIGWKPIIIIYIFVI